MRDLNSVHVRLMFLQYQIAGQPVITEGRKSVAVQLKNDVPGIAEEADNEK